MLDGWTPRSKGIHLAFGGWYASGVERYAHSRASGASHTAAQLAMVRWVLTASGERDADGEWRPWSSGDHKDANIKNRYTLLRSLVWNTEDRQDSPYKTLILANGRPAVELSFNFRAFEVNGEPVSLSGHLDEVVVGPDNNRWIKDDKTTKGALGAHYAQGYSPDNQMSLYSVAGKVILNEPVQGVLVRAAQIGVTFTRFQTFQVPRPQAVLSEWMEETEWWINQAHSMAVANYYPRNDKACGNYGGCVFQKVCSVSPTHRKAWLEEDFTVRRWNPLEQRGDV